MWFRDLGYIACIIEGERRGEDRSGTPSDVHHEVKGYRTGHHRTIPLCPWHHRGVPPGQFNDHENPHITTAELFGPSLKHSPSGFTNRYGTFDELWTRVESELESLETIGDGRIL